jgi:hypothetical protein
MNSFSAEIEMSAINFPPMSHGEEMDFALFNVERINDPVITYTQPVTISAFHSIMCEAFEPDTHFINFRFDSSLNVGGKIEKYCIEPRIINLKRPAHAYQG